MELLKDKTILIVGLGLIGGSVARALSARSLCRRVLAHGRDETPLRQAREDGSIDEYSLDLAGCAPRADLILVCVPPRTMKEVFRELAGLASEHAVITDAASVKATVMADFAEVFPGAVSRFVPGHPIAGSERSGYAASREDLFERRKTILTPDEETDAAAVHTVAGLWRGLGADVHGMSAARHDAVLAATSHLPHLLAYTLVNTLAGSSGDADRVQQVFDYAAGGFADFTRIASSEPGMWRDVFLSNTSATVAVLDAYMADLGVMRDTLLAADGEALQSAFSRARATRNHFIAASGAATGQTMPAAGSVRGRVDYLARAGEGLRGEIRVPGDKSISHRAIIFGAIANGVTGITGFLEGEDSLHTLQAFRDMGVPVMGPEDGQLRIYGVGSTGLRASGRPIYLGNSGTAMRLLSGLLAAQPFDSELQGDASLSRRPMNRVAEPLRRMGAEIETAEGGTPPLRIHGRPLRGIDYEMPVASAQVKSCLMLAGLYADGETRITEPAPCRDHTERMLQGFGYAVDRSGQGQARLRGGGELSACHIDVPADVSSAAFFLVAASITPGSVVKLLHVGVNPTRTGIINLLRAMGGDIRLSNEKEVGGEPVADIEVRHAPLKGIEVPAGQIPLAIDEFPVLFVAAACAEGETSLSGAEELRVKETDRIQAMADGLTAMGADVQTRPDGLSIRGGALRGADVDSLGDHRIAMSFAVAALRADGPVRIRDCANVSTSFPGFVSLARRIGFPLEVLEEGA